MKLSFKTSQFLITSFAAIILIGCGQDLQASQIGVADPEEVKAVTSSRSPEAIEVDRLEAIEHHPKSAENTLLSMPPELIMEFLHLLDPKSLSAVAQASKALAEIVALPYFQKQYCGVTSVEYINIVHNQITGIFGSVYGLQMQKFLASKPVYVYGPSVTRLIEPETIALLQANRNDLAKEICKKFSTQDIIEPLHIRKALTIASYARVFFTVEGERAHPAFLQVMHYLDALSSDQIDDFIRLRNQYADVFFPEGMSELDKQYVTEVLLPLGTDRIRSLARDLVQHKRAFSDVDKSQRPQLRVILTLLTPDQRAILVQIFRGGLSEVVQRLFFMVYQLFNTEGRLELVASFEPEDGDTEIRAKIIALQDE